MATSLVEAKTEFTMVEQAYRAMKHGTFESCFLVGTVMPEQSPRSFWR